MAKFASVSLSCWCGDWALSLAELSGTTLCVRLAGFAARGCRTGLCLDLSQWLRTSAKGWRAVRLVASGNGSCSVWRLEVVLQSGKLAKVRHDSTCSQCRRIQRAGFFHLKALYIVAAYELRLLILTQIGALSLLDMRSHV